VGQDRQAAGVEQHTRLLSMLDKHQEDGYLQALKIIEVQQGVMICDGVGLGKSFIALALMEQLLRLGKNVLAACAKEHTGQQLGRAILREYLQEYSDDFGSIVGRPMTALGFDPGLVRRRDTAKADTGASSASCRRADMIVIDESHTSARAFGHRYVNLIRQSSPSTEAQSSHHAHRNAHHTPTPI